MVITEVPDPGAGMLDGLKLTVTPEGAPLDDREIALLSPPEMLDVMVEVPLDPCSTVTELGLAVNVKLGEEPEETVSESMVVWVWPPPAPRMVIE
jgi:hypothetical protein